MSGEVQQSIFIKKSCFQMVTGGLALISLQVQIEITFSFILKVRGQMSRESLSKHEDYEQRPGSI